MSDFWESAIEALGSFHCHYRIKWSQDDQPTDWERWVIFPAQGWLETGSLGPVRIREVEWIEVNPIETRHIGRLVNDKTIDHTAEIIKVLDDIPIGYRIVENCIRIDSAQGDVTS